MNPRSTMGTGQVNSHHKNSNKDTIAYQKKNGNNFSGKCQKGHDVKDSCGTLGGSDRQKFPSKESHDGHGPISPYETHGKYKSVKDISIKEGVLIENDLDSLSQGNGDFDTNDNKKEPHGLFEWIDREIEDHEIPMA